MGKILHTLLDILFPRHFSVVQLENTPPHKLLEYIPRATPHRLPYIESVFAYQNPTTKKLVWQIKYNNNQRIANAIASCMHDLILESLSDDLLFENASETVLVPIPMSQERKKKRGFNQALLLAHHLYKKDPSAYFDVCDILSYNQVHRPQTSIRNRKERQRNMHNCMKVTKPEKIQNKNVILIDDVSTTGATVEEAKRVLKDAKNVRAITIAH